MPRSKRKVPWLSEADMCDAAIAEFASIGWVAHPETFEFDFVLVGPKGERIGVEAKLRPSLEVLAQACRHSTAVHCRAVLVPFPTHDFRAVAARCKVRVWDFGYRAETPTLAHWRAMAAVRDLHLTLWTETVTGELPTVRVEGHRAGLPAPRKVTDWKLKAVKFCLDNADKTFTRTEFAATGLSMTLWGRSRWIRVVGQAPGPKGRPVVLYQLTDAPDRPDRKFPEIVAALQNK